MNQLIIPEYLRLAYNENDRSIQMADIKVSATEAQHPLFFALPAAVRKTIFAAVSTVSYKAGAIVCRFLDQGTTFYKVISGSLAVYRDADCQNQIGELGEGRFFGELAAFTGKPRSASVKALTDVVLLSIPSPLAFLDADEKVAFQHEIRGILGIYEAWYLSKALRSLPLSSFITMLRFSESVDVEPATSLVKKGDGLSNLYIVIKGIVDVHLDGLKTIQLTAGDVFGEMSILHSTYANADVVTRTACRLAKFSPEAAQDMIRANEKFSVVLEAIAEMRKL